MPKYKYVAYNLKGERVLGESSAQNPENLKFQLKTNKLILNSYTTIGEKEKKEFSLFKSKTISETEKINFTRELGVMIESGLSLLSALGVQESMVKKHFLKEIVLNLKEVINRGGSLFSGFNSYRKNFGDIYVNLIKIGELSGTLGKTLVDLSELMEKNDDIRKKVRSALVYPGVVLFITLTISSFLILNVLPAFLKMFTDSGVKLPFLTQFLLDISIFIRKNYIFVIISIVITLFLLKKFFSTLEGKKLGMKIVYRIPVIGNLILMSVTLRFSRTFSTLLDAGISVVKSLEIASQGVGDPLFEEKIKIVNSEIQAGGKIASSLDKTKYFTIATVTMIAVGEESGEIVSMLKKIANYNERQLNQVIRDSMALIEPIMMVILGFIVGSIVLALYLPMFEMINTIK